MEKNCIDCKTIITKRATRCKKCANTGKLNPFYKSGKNKKEYKCKDCGKERSSDAVRCKKCNFLYQAYWMSKYPHKHPMYIDGRSRFPYPIKFSFKYKETIRIRDKRRCKLCNKTEKQNHERLSIHHIDYNKLNIKKTNLISLCRKCNSKVNKNRKYWIKYFKNIIKRMHKSWKKK